MQLSQLVLRNAVRSPLRAAMTVLTVAILLAAFVFPRALLEAQLVQVRDSPDNRVVTQPKMGWGVLLPARYGDEIRATEGVNIAVGSRWTGFKVPGKDDFFFAAFAVDPGPMIAMHHELVAPPQQKQAFLANERSALVSVDLAQKFGWKLGDRVIFQSRELPGEWAFEIACIYEAVKGEWAKRSVWVHYAHFNLNVPAEARDQLSFVSAQIHEPNQGGRIAKAIDLHFDASPVRTLSMEDRVQTAANIGRFGAILTALEVVSYLILFVVLTILTNTLSMNVRERAREFGVLRAIGFGPGHLAVLVLGESVLLGLVGALVGLVLSYLVIEGVLSPYLQETLQFPALVIPLRVALGAVAASGILALLAAALPALRLIRLEVRESLGQVT
jgi:putative ABC transport system permease protein